MKREYDFSKGQRGKFYRPNARLNLPVYLDPDVAQFIKKFAKKKNLDTQTVINDLLRKNMEMVKSLI